jgi:hypothetical protein
VSRSDYLNEDGSFRWHTTSGWPVFPYPGVLPGLRGIGVDDHPPPFEFAAAGHDEMVRTLVPYIETLLPDAEAWHVLFDDAFHIETFKTIHGNKPWLRKRNG